MIFYLDFRTLTKFGTLSKLIKKVDKKNDFLFVFYKLEKSLKKWIWRGKNAIFYTKRCYIMYSGGIYATFRKVF
ncbi:MAG: hypothetical protein EAZ20_08080 [Bacteroidetes bacterium]|nr:MAG: hypothetical protein EAZ20_08080 [Bacteroidota bacterium]